MSKSLQATIYVDESVSSVDQARSYAQSAANTQSGLKQEMWGLVMATPKDIVNDGEDVVSTLRERFNDIWEQLWDSFIDEYKYEMIADDAEYVEDSLVKKLWDKEAEERKRQNEEQKRRHEFFQKYKGVLNPYSFDDIRIYEEWSNGSLELPQALTEEERNKIVHDINKKEEERMNERLKEIKYNE
jgi:hypothetical protein